MKSPHPAVAMGHANQWQTFMDSYMCRKRHMYFVHSLLTRWHGYDHWLVSWVASQLDLPQSWVKGYRAVASCPVHLVSPGPLHGVPIFCMLCTCVVVMSHVYMLMLRKIRSNISSTVYKSIRSVEASQTNPTPECVINGTVCYGGWVWVIYLFYIKV